MTTLTLVTLAVIVYGVLNREGYGRALALGGATPIGAAAVAGDTAVPTFYAVAIGAAIGVLLRLLGRTRRRERITSPPAPGVRPLILLAIWAFAVTISAPLLFDGATVLSPDAEETVLHAGTLTTSNLAQINYLVLSISVVIYLAYSDHVGPQVVGLAATLATLLSFWAYLNGTFGVPYPEGVFDNSPGFRFIDTAPGGLERFRGIFSEPSGLAISSLVTIAYGFSRQAQLVGWRRAGLLAVTGIALFLASISTSATFVVAGVALALLAAGAFIGRFVLRRGPLSPLAVTIACAAAIAGVWILPQLAIFVEETVNDKVASSSFDERSGADSISYELLFDTFGLGVGLGSHRPSSFLAALLSTVGLIGTALFVAAVAAVIQHSYAVREYRPVVWALVAMLVTKIVAGPDLADTSGILWLSIGVLAHVARRRVARDSHGSLTPSITPAPDPARREISSS